MPYYGGRGTLRRMSSRRFHPCSAAIVTQDFQTLRLSVDEVTWVTLKKRLRNQYELGGAKAIRPAIRDVTLWRKKVSDFLTHGGGASCRGARTLALSALT